MICWPNKSLTLCQNVLSWSRSQKGGKKEQEDETWLVVEPTHLKNMLVKLETFPQ